MSRSAWIVWVALGLGVGSPVSAGSVSLGSHLGVGVLTTTSKNAGRTTLIAWPSNPLGYQPALRVALSDQGHAHELQLDTGFLYIDDGGSGYSLFTAMLSYQHTFRADDVVAPYVNLGAGLYRESSAAAASTKPSAGIGAGVRRRVGDRHGALRGEFRADYLQSDSVTGRPGLTTIGVRLGFDLWM
jgi:hypothetical protein